MNSTAIWHSLDRVIQALDGPRCTVHTETDTIHYRARVSIRTDQPDQPWALITLDRMRDRYNAYLLEPDHHVRDNSDAPVTGYVRRIPIPAEDFYRNPTEAWWPIAHWLTHGTLPDTTPDDTIYLVTPARS